MHHVGPSSLGCVCALENECPERSTSKLEKLSTAVRLSFTHCHPYNLYLYVKMFFILYTHAVALAAMQMYCALCKYCSFNHVINCTVSQYLVLITEQGTTSLEPGAHEG